MTTDGAGCILFLDFDGVTHPDPCDAGQHFTQLPLIEEVLRPYPACKIVISSSWRVVHPLNEMRKFFAADMRPRVIGVTPEHGGPGGNGSWGVAVNHERQWECERWLLTGGSWGSSGWDGGFGDGGGGFGGGFSGGGGWSGGGGASGSW